MASTASTLSDLLKLGHVGGVVDARADNGPIKFRGPTCLVRGPNDARHGKGEFVDGQRLGERSACDAGQRSW
jgi:hypothetical protein